MTIGDQIQELRKRDGLSQEALAEKLGLSRQAVSKWESGAAIPTIDNLIELSRLFSVTVDALLGAPAADASRPDALSAAAVGKLLDEYAARQEKTRRRYMLWGAGMLMAVLALAAALTMRSESRVGQLNRDVAGLRESIGGIRADLNGQMASFTQQLQAQMDAQESLVTDYARTFVSYDPQTRMVTFTLTATPKTFSANMAATVYASSDATAGAPVKMQRQGTAFSATLSVPAEAKETKFFLTLHTDGVAGNQLLETAFNIGSSYCMRMDAKFAGSVQGQTVAGEVICMVSPAYRDEFSDDPVLSNWPVSGRVEAVVGDAVVRTFIIEDITDPFTAEGTTEGVPIISECWFYTRVDGAYEGDVTFRAVLVDNYGAAHTATVVP